MNVSVSSQWIHLYLTQARFCSWLLATLIQTRTNTNIKLCACTELILSGETLGKSQQLRWTQPSKTLQKEDRTGGHALQCNGPEAEEQTAGLDAMKNTKKEMRQRGDGASARNVTGHAPVLALHAINSLFFIKPR